MDTPSNLLRTRLSHEIALLSMEVIELEKQKVEAERKLDFYLRLEQDLEKRGMAHVFG